MRACWRPAPPAPDAPRGGTKVAPYESLLDAIMVPQMMQQPTKNGIWKWLASCGPPAYKRILHMSRGAERTSVRGI